MFVHRLTWRPLYAPDETGGGATDPPTAGTDPPANPPEAETPEQVAARLKEDHERELNRYRNEVGQERKKARELEARLQAIEDEKKPELERLTDAAGRVPVLEKERDTWKERAEAAEAALSEEVDARRKALPKEMTDLVPGGGPIEQLAWIRKASAAAEKLKPAGLPPSGGRNPGTGDGKAELTEKERSEAARHYAGRF